MDAVIGLFFLLDSETKAIMAPPFIGEFMNEDVCEQVLAQVKADVKSNIAFSEVRGICIPVEDIE